MNYGKKKASKRQKNVTSKAAMKKKTSWCPPFQGHAAYLSCRDCTMCRRRRTFHQKDD